MTKTIPGFIVLLRNKKEPTLYVFHNGVFSVSPTEDQLNLWGFWDVVKVINVSQEIPIVI